MKSEEGRESREHHFAALQEKGLDTKKEVASTSDGGLEADIERGARQLVRREGGPLFTHLTAY